VLEMPHLLMLFSPVMFKKLKYNCSSAQMINDRETLRLSYFKRLAIYPSIFKSLARKEYIMISLGDNFGLANKFHGQQNRGDRFLYAGRQIRGGF
jgi:hypothetical protein